MSRDGIRKRKMGVQHWLPEIWAAGDGEDQEHR